MVAPTPVVTTDLALAIVRLVVGLVVSAHGAQKLFGVWGGAGLAGWTAGMARMGMRPARFWGPVTAIAEFGGGIALALGFLVPISAALVTLQMFGAFVKVHRQEGFWVNKGGYEYNLVLAAAAVAIGLAEPSRWSLDNGLGIGTLGGGAYVAVVAIGLLAYIAGSRPVIVAPAGNRKAA